jgi:flagellar biogenesis protein FliO
VQGKAMKKFVNLAILNIVFILSTLSRAEAKASLESVIHKENGGDQVEIQIAYKGDLGKIPTLSTKDSIVQLEIPDSTVWPKIEKKIAINSASPDTTLLAYQYDKDLVRVRALLPYNLSGFEDKVEFKVEKDLISIKFPKVAKNKGEAATPVWKTDSSESSDQIEKYDESYLNKLLEEKKGTAPESQTKQEIKTDQVTIKQSALDDNKGFSYAKYVGKFLAFLGVILVFFYFVVNLFRKGVLKKGALGFLHNPKMVSVLSTTHIGAKRSLLVVKAHNQTFLLSSSEKGVTLISELAQTSEIVRESERMITGNNFETSLSRGEEEDKEFKLKDFDVQDHVDIKKEVMMKSNVKKEERLSDQIKNKVKSLKPLQ